MRERRTNKAGKGLLTGIVGALSFAAPGLLASQVPTAPATWSLRGLEEGLCVDFLVSPQVAADEVGRYGTPIPAESLATDHPALAREVRDEPKYQGWVPAEYCWYLYASGVAKGKTFTVDDGRQPVAVGFVAIAARDLPEGATAYVTQLFTNSSQLSSAAEVARLRVERFKFTRSPIPDQEDLADHYRFEAQHGETIVRWDGGPGDPTPVAPRSIHLAGLASFQIHFVRTTITPDSSFTASGSLQVAGEGDLQTLLSASPIRHLTTLTRGGDSEWELVP